MKFRSNSTSIGFQRIGAAVLLAGVMLLLLLSEILGTPHAKTPKKILALYWDNRESPADDILSKNFQAVMDSVPAETVEYYSEYLEATRFPGENQALLARDYLRQKYSNRPIDVIVAFGDVPLDFLLKYRDSLFTHIPIVFLTVRRFTTQARAAGAGMTGIIYFNAYKETLELALRLHPGTEQVFIVSGSTDHDKRYETLCREQLQDYESHVSINYLTDISPDELTSQLKNLPKRSLVFYIWQQARLEDGRILETRDVLAQVVHVSAVPIYGVANWQIGRGIVGGYLRTNETTGTRAAEMALRIVNGERAQDISVEAIPIVPMFDWRELRRWGIAEDLLPRGSVVRNRVPSFWEEYKWYAVALTSVLILQSTLIAGLIINHVRRKRAEMALRAAQESLTITLEASQMGTWDLDLTRDYSGHRSLRNDQIFGYDTPKADWGREIARCHIVEEDQKIFDAAFARAQKTGELYFEARVHWQDGSIHWMAARGRFYSDETGQPIRGAGVNFDITERKAAEEALSGLSGQLIHAREDECARIARELHDDLNQRMAIIAIELDQLRQATPEKDGQLLGNLQKLMDQVVDVSREIHRISHDLHPSKLTQLGLVAATKSLCDELHLSHDLKIEFYHERIPADLSHDISLCLYRLVQECLNNVIKHSGAAKVQVELRGIGEEIRLRVSDTGKGFDVESPRTRKGLGLISMRERLRLVGGQISIGSHPDCGTQIEVRIPLRRIILDYKSSPLDEKTQAAQE
jgi:PAS domain S-box-containing protein